MVFECEDIREVLSYLPCISLEDRKNFPSSPCVYFAISSRGDILYVGRTKNLRKRWGNHHRYEDLIKLGGVVINYISSDVVLLPHLEKALIDHAQPPLNRQGVTPRLTQPQTPRPISEAPVGVPVLGVDLDELGLVEEFRVLVFQGNDIWVHRQAGGLYVSVPAPDGWLPLPVVGVG